MTTKLRFATAVNSLLLAAPLFAGCGVDDDTAVTDVVLDGKSDTFGTYAQLSPNNPRAYLHHHCDNDDGCAIVMAVQLYDRSACTFFRADDCGTTVPDISRTLGALRAEARTSDGQTNNLEVPLIAYPNAASQTLALVASFAQAGTGTLFTVEQDQNVVWPANVTPVRAWNAYIAARPLKEHRVSERPAAAIPENTMAGASSTIQIDDTAMVYGVEVGVDITHPRVGDLVLKLHHPGGTVLLRDRVATDWTNLRTSFAPSLPSAPGTGEWRLEVIDAATGETGTLESWSLTLYR